MEANIVDLRYRMKEVLKALERNERVRILYHGKVKGIIMPSGHERGPEASVTAHPFFNMSAADVDVDAGMDKLRGGRHRDL